MTLKRQLFLASLLMPVIPWAGLQFVLELDQALRAQAQEQLLGQARRMADVVAAELSGQPPLTELEHAIFMHRADRPIHLDGYGDEWPGFQDGNQSWQSLAGQPDIRWRREVADISRYVAIQRELLETAASLLLPGGVLVYATCSLEPEENQDVVATFLANNPHYTLEDCTPHLPAGAAPLVRDGCFQPRPSDKLDGFFAARLVRRLVNA